MWSRGLDIKLYMSAFAAGFVLSEQQIHADVFTCAWDLEGCFLSFDAQLKENQMCVDVSEFSSEEQKI